MTLVVACGWKEDSVYDLPGKQTSEAFDVVVKITVSIHASCRLRIRLPLKVPVVQSSGIHIDQLFRYGSKRSRLVILIGTHCPRLG